MKDPSHWLFKFDAGEWIRAAMTELRHAEDAYKSKNARAGLAGARRAAGMALNAILVGTPNDAWGRSYMDHLLALQHDGTAPERVRDAAKTLTETPLPGGALVALRTSSGDERVLEACRDVLAHAYALVHRAKA